MRCGREENRSAKRRCECERREIDSLLVAQILMFVGTSLGGGADILINKHSSSVDSSCTVYCQGTLGIPIPIVQ
jgi:hypothetical protein